MIHTSVTTLETDNYFKYCKTSFCCFFFFININKKQSFITIKEIKSIHAEDANCQKSILNVVR